jgi:hypothetical protein
MRYFGITLGIFLIVAISDLVRRKRLKEEFAIIWSLVALFLVVVSVFIKVPRLFSQFLGFQLVSNFLIASLLVILILITFYLTVIIGRFKDELHVLNIEIAIIKNKLKQTEESGKGNFKTKVRKSIK